MGTLSGYVDPLALVGRPPEHRAYRWRALSEEIRFYMPLIDPTAIIEAFATIDAGLERATSVGAETLVMKHAHIGHDASVGTHTDIAPGVIVGGHCRIGNHVKVGLGACVRPRVTIGDNAIIGAGAVVVKDVPAHQTWAGNPAGPLREYVLAADRDLWEEWFEEWHPASGSDAWPKRADVP